MAQALKYGLLIVCIVWTTGLAKAQGCSDAGFCTAGALQHKPAADSLPQSSLGISLTIGSGEQGTTIITPQAEWTQQLSASWRLELKLPYYLATGNLGTHSGIGDPIATVSKSWVLKQAWKVFAIGGTRVSLTDAGASDEHGRPLPMPYQHGLGTTDLIAGVAAQYKTWLSLSAGYQQPLFQYNNNAYLAQALPLESDDYKAYFDSRKLERRGDVLLRAEGTYTRNRWSLTGGPLLIYHLGDDRITRPSGQDITLPGSQGATLNIAAKLAYGAKKSHWELAGGAPFVVRSVRPDGLTRHWVLTLRYKRSRH